MESKKITYLVDANVCVGFFDQDDKLHHQAQEALKTIRSQGTSVLLLDHVIQEALTVMLYNGKNDEALYFIESAFRGQDLDVVDTPAEWLQDAMHLAQSQSYKPKMSTVDWVLLSRSVATGIPILTFDKQLLVASKKLC